MINAMEVLVKHLQNSNLTGNMQVAVKHRYPSPWAIGSKSIVVIPDGGPPEMYLPVYNQRVEIQCYAADPYSALLLLDQVSNLARETDRVKITTTKGVGILYSIIADSGPSLLYNSDINMDFALAFFEIKVSHHEV